MMQTVVFLTHTSLCTQKQECQAQQHFQQQLRQRHEEEELQRQTEQLQAEARKESEDHKHQHDKSQQQGDGKPGDKPKRPSSLLGNNNVMKLKQIIPLQGKFSSGTARSPQSPTGSEAKLPGFLSLKFFKSPEVKKEPVLVTAVSGTVVTATSGSQERSQSPNRTFSPGKLFSFSRSEGSVVCVNGAHPSKLDDAPQAQNTQPPKPDLNTPLEEFPSTE